MATSQVNPHAMPHITKVVINVGIGKQRDDKAFVEAVKRDVAAITGQYPVATQARTAIAGFKVRQGNTVGYRVTLRGKRMEDFIQRFVHITMPRVRDFRGISSKSVDQQGNLHVGVREHLAFPEIHADKTDSIFGVQVSFVSTAKNKDESVIMYKDLGFPLSDDKNVGQDSKKKV